METTGTAIKPVNEMRADYYLPRKTALIENPRRKTGVNQRRPPTRNVSDG